MQKKAEMSLTRLSLMLIGLVIIWIMCNQGQNQFSQRFEQELANKLGGTNINNQKLQVAMKIKNSHSKQQQQKAKDYMNTIFNQKYNLSVTQQQTICVVVRSFYSQSQGDDEYLTFKSIITQQYKNYHIIYLSEKNNPSIPKLENYLTSNQIHDDKYTFIDAKADTISSLLLASNKCPQNGLIMIMENGEQLITSKLLILINQLFHPKQKRDLIWSNTLYKNDKLGFSLAYPEQTKKNKNFRDYAFAANEVNVFKNSLLIENKKQFTENTLIYPFWLPQSYMLNLMQKAINPNYIPQILTIKNKNKIFRSSRSQSQSDLSNLIFKKQSIIPLIQKQNKHINKN